MSWSAVVLAAGALLASAPARAEDPAREAGTAVVTGTRLPRPLPDDPVPVTVLPRAELARSPSLTLDDLVRTVPSVSAFRRSSSLVADPTAQGLTLRGVGPSGVSRGLLLVDGVPANDPFGGWVYWRALPPSSLDRVEVAPGGGSALYGSAAMGGVVQVFSRPIEGSRVEGDLAAGTNDTYLGGLHAAGTLGRAGLAIDADGMTTGGWIPVAPAQRGAADVPATSRHATVHARAALTATPALRLELGARGFLQDETAGTRDSGASVRLGTLRGALRHDGAAGTLEVTAFTAAERFEQERARVDPARATAELAGRQRVPASQVGGALTFAPSAPRGAGHELLAGLDLRRVEGTSDEQLFPPTGSSADVIGRRSSGEQQFAGVFVQDLWRPHPAWLLSATLRLDAWRNLDGERTTATSSAGIGPVERFPARAELQVSPRLGVLFRPVAAVALRASAYRSFRAPSLNELYRPFQVGTVLTDANPALATERLVGAELGVDVVAGTALTARVTGFWSRLADPIANVTLEAPAASGATRQRRNLGAARILGLEATLAWRLARRWTLSGSYLFVDPRVVDAPAAPELVGKLLAQDPRHRATAALLFDDPRVLTAEIEARLVGEQFEDDRNALPMGGYVVVSASLARRVAPGLELYAAGENLLDRRYLAGRAGVDTLGTPLLARIGIRARWEP
jgi:outer membrane receptor protein involved in Fe transport